jgi:pimeloyl-ACP methyl ester carboxylesterase
MGGGIAGRFAQLFPERPLSLMILDSNTAAAQPVAPKMREVREHTAELCDSGDMREAARYYLANSPAYKLFAANSEANRARLHDMIAANNPVGFANTLRAMLAPDSSPAEMNRIIAPTLVVAGEHDPAIAAIRITHEGIANSVLKEVPGAGHLSNVDAPEELLAVIEGFLDSVTG